MKSAYLFTYLKDQLNEKELAWLSSKKGSNCKDLALAFVLASRKIKKEFISSNSLWKTFDPKWSLDIVSKEAIVRAYLLMLMHENARDEEEYMKWINDLFDTAEMNEAVALIQFLLISLNPKALLPRAKDAVRSNVGNIFDAIAFQNPYSFHFFEEAAWNQLILKCIFNDKPIHLIVGLDERRNQALADTLSDFAHERWAAGRRVPSQVWRLVVPFINPTLTKDISKLIIAEDQRDQLAACLVLQESKNELLNELKNQHLNLIQKYASFTWNTLENNEPIYTGQ
jgi:hypothetical protein